MNCKMVGAISTQSSCRRLAAAIWVAVSAALAHAGLTAFAVGSGRAVVQSSISVGRRPTFRSAGSLGGSIWEAGASRNVPRCGRAVFLLVAAAFVPTTFLRRRGRRCCSASGIACRAHSCKNLAVVFIKPHANTVAAREVVPQFLRDRGIEVVRQGSVVAADIDQKGIIDSHYSAIARIGMERDMAALGLKESAAEKFASGYGITLQDAMVAGKLHSAATALEVLKVSPGELLNRCLAAGYEKLGSGLYAAKLDGPGGEPIYVLNGFYARMREKFVAPGVAVEWFVISFEEDKMPWKKFRSEVIGSTNPMDAVDFSLRAKVRDEWQALGLKEETNYQDNGVHASAGPLEALRERMIWLGEDPQADPFGAALLEKGVERERLQALLENPRVDLGSGKEDFVFDLLEDVDTQEALKLLAASK